MLSTQFIRNSMLAEIINIIASPAGLVVGIIYAVLGTVVTGFLNLIYGKSKNAVFTFTKERSEKQKAARRRRVELIRREEKYFHYYLSSANGWLLMSVMFLIIASISFVIGLAAMGNDSIYIMVLFFVLGGLCWITSLYIMFESIAMRLDAARSLFSDKPPEPPEENNEVPL